MLNPEIVAVQEQETRVMAEGFIDKVNVELTDIKHSFFRIGFLLSEANELGYYKSLGYQNITELAEDKFGFKQSTTYELMQVYELAHSEQAPMQIADKYEKYSKSQLTEFCKVKCLTENFMSIVSPSDTVADIKEAVKLWNKHYYNCYSKVHSIAELLEKYREPKPSAAQSVVQGQLPGQTVIDISEVQNVEGFNAVNSFSEYSEKPEVSDEPETVAEAPEQIERSKIEIIKVGLTGVDVYVKDAKYLIYDRYRNEPLKSAFSEFIKSVYNYNNKANFYHGFAAADLHRSYSEKGVEFIAFEPYQNVKLTWEEVARYISDLIYTDEYLSETEQAAYIEWKAERDGLTVNVEPAAEPVSESAAENYEYSENDEADKKQTRRMLLEKLPTKEFAKEICNHIYAKSIGYTDFMPPENLMREWLINWLDEVVE